MISESFHTLIELHWIKLIMVWGQFKQLISLDDNQVKGRKIFEMDNQRFDFYKRFTYNNLKALSQDFILYDQFLIKQLEKDVNEIEIFCYSDILYSHLPNSDFIILISTQEMYRQVKYTIKIQPQPQKNLRKNINALYVVLISDKDSHRIFSQPILVDSDRESEIYSTNDIEYNRVELWNYDKMKMIEEQKTAFSMCEQFTFSCKVEEITYTVTKSQVAKSSKIVDSIKTKQTPTIGVFWNDSKNSSGEYQNIPLKKIDQCSNKTESEEESTRNTRNNKSPSIRIISAKEYHAY